ncbi:PREDICTED: uncharacterized protein LOC106127670 [Papilio xuthus]|uniref:Uncharacterized protein LOC106127670 n=1 Tax=Papilio xuthus TaxID=66420 RepID=A0AAJ7EKU8_PAPXU|nr:PREDICTED: uncharacterized protein LOC106127670 [Papilio xuthus]
MTTMHFEYDPEKLIKEIKKRPGLWDSDDVAYRSKAIRQKLWTDVVKELIEPNVKFTKCELRELEIQLQKKWKSIRDCFQKYVVNPNRHKRPYIYSKKLSFLLKEEPAQAGASTESEDGEKTSSVWRTRRKLKIKKESSDDNDDSETYGYNDDTKSNASNDVGDDENETQTLPKKTKTNSLVGEIAFANVDAQSFNESEDSDKLFLLSLLPHLKSIPEEFKLNVKMDMMNVLRNANFNTNLNHKII